MIVEQACPACGATLRFERSASQELGRCERCGKEMHLRTRRVRRWQVWTAAIVVILVAILWQRERVMALPQRLGDDVGNTISTGHMLTVDESGGASLASIIGYPQDVDAFTYVPARSGDLMVHVATDDPAASIIVTAANQDGPLTLVDRDQATGSVQSRLEVLEDEPVTILIRGAQGWRGSVAGTLTWDVGSTVDSARMLDVELDGIVRLEGSLEASDDIDVYVLEMPACSHLVVDDTESPARHLDARLLRVVDGSVRQLQAGLPLEHFAPSAERVVLQVAHSARAEAPEAYELEILVESDDHADSMEHATALEMSMGFVEAMGEISVSHDTDVFSIVADRSGLMRISVSELGASLGLNMSASTRDGVAFVNDGALECSRAVKQGDRCFVSVAGRGSGQYALAAIIIEDDHADDIDEATPFDAGAPVLGRLERSGDVDWFSFMPDVSGDADIRLSALSRRLDVKLAVYDDAKGLLGENDDAQRNVDFNSRLHLAVEAGRRYYVSAAAHQLGNKPNEYRLEVRLE